MSSVIPDIVPSTTWAASPASADVNMAAHKITNTSSLTIGSVTVTSPSTNVLDIGSATGGQLKAASAALSSMNLLNSGVTGYYDASGNLKSAVSLDGTGALAVGTAPLNTGMKVYGSTNVTGNLFVGVPGSYNNISTCGGNANGYVYGSFPKFGDGVHVGYNYYADASGSDVISNAGGATSRVSCKYGSVDIFSGALNTAPTTLCATFSNGQVGIGTSNPRAPLQIGTGDGDKIVLNELAGIAGSKIASTAGYGLSMYSGRSAQNDGGYFTFNTSNGTGYAEQVRINNTGLGIGTTAPTALLDVSGGDIKVSGSGTQKLVFGNNAWNGNTGVANTDGMCIRYGSRVGNLKYLMMTDPYYNNTLLNNPTMSVVSDRDNLRIGMSAINTQASSLLPLNIQGTIMQPWTDNATTLGSGTYRWSTVYSATATINTSDARLKTDVSEIPVGLDFIEALRPVDYRWIDGGKVQDGVDELGAIKFKSVPGVRKHWGFISQEVRKAMDDAGVDAGVWVRADKDDAESTQMLRYEELIAPLVKAVQELSAKVRRWENTSPEPSC